MSAVAESVWNSSTSLVSSAPWLRDAWAELETFGALAEGWDTYGSPSITPIALDMAHDLVLRLAEKRTRRPEIRPVSGGGLQLEWRSGGRELELMVSPDGRVFWMVLSTTGESFDGELPADAEAAEIGADLARALFLRE